MKVVVTGGAGFIGSHIVEQLLANGHEPLVIDDLSSGLREQVPDGVTLEVVDVRQKGELARIFASFQPDAICHQAAQLSVSRSVREPGFDAEVNIVGMLHLLELAVEHQVKRFVFASSGGVLYGDVSEPVDETYPSAPVSPYGISKWAGEQYLQFFGREYGLPSVALRYANVYGPRQNPHGEAGVVAIFSTKMLAGEPATVNGDGKSIRDYVYVSDVARANVLALEADFDTLFEPFNIGTAVPTDVNQLEAMLRDLLQIQTGASIPSPNHGPARAGDLRSSLISYQKADSQLGWQPTVDLQTGLRQTVEWFARRQS